MVGRVSHSNRLRLVAALWMVGGIACTRENTGEDTSVEVGNQACDDANYIYEREDLAAIAHCEEIRALGIDGLDWIEEIDLPNLRRIDDFLVLNNNASLLSLDGLSSLESVGGEVLVRNCGRVENLDALSYHGLRQVGLLL